MKFNPWQHILVQPLRIQRDESCSWSVLLQDQEPTFRLLLLLVPLLQLQPLHPICWNSTMDLQNQHPLLHLNPLRLLRRKLPLLHQRMICLEA